jgi:hydrogenase nickel incorporation protein HypA/HybF
VFRVEVGELSGVEPELLASAVEVLLADGDERHATLHLERVPVEASCEGCGHEFRVNESDYRCTQCGDPRLHLLRGESLTLRDVTFETEEP